MHTKKGTPYRETRIGPDDPKMVEIGQRIKRVRLTMRRARAGDPKAKAELRKDFGIFL